MNDKPNGSVTPSPDVPSSSGSNSSTVPATRSDSLHSLLLSLGLAALSQVEQKYLVPGTVEAVTPHLGALIKDYIPETTIPPEAQLLGKMGWAMMQREYLARMAARMVERQKQGESEGQSMGEGSKGPKRQMSDPY